MIATYCKHENKQKNGKDRHGNQRYRCPECLSRFADVQVKPLGDLRIDRKRAVMVLRMMLEGTSMRAINRLTGVDRETMSDLMLLIGQRSQRFMDAKIRSIAATDVQCDELWSFVGCKDKVRSAMHKSDELGDCYTFIGLERHSKLVLAYHVGKRDISSTRIFASKLRDAITTGAQITTDGFPPYTQAITVTLWDRDIHFAQLIKSYGKPAGDDTRYSPATITGIDKKLVWGNPDESQICTSHVERFNLSLRMGLRRFTRLTNAFSKSLKHHEAAISLWIMYYNYGRVHQTLGTTPAVEAGLASETWTVDRMLDELAAF